jgi:hypothetical protein
MGFSDLVKTSLYKDHVTFQGILRRTHVEITISKGVDNIFPHPARLVELHSEPSKFDPFIGRLESVRFNETSKADFIQLSDTANTYNVTAMQRPRSSASIIFDFFEQRLSREIPSDQDLDEIQNVLTQCLRLVFCAHSDGIVIRACPSTWHLIQIHPHDSKKYIYRVMFNGDDFALVWGGSLQSEFLKFEYHDSSCPILQNLRQQPVVTSGDARKITVVSDEDVRQSTRGAGHKTRIRFAGGPELPEFCPQALGQCQCCPIPSKNVDIRLTGLLFLKVLSGGRLQDSNFQSPLDLFKSLHLGTSTETLNALFGVDSLDMVSSLDSIRHFARAIC